MPLQAREGTRCYYEQERICENDMEFISSNLQKDDKLHTYIECKPAGCALNSTTACTVPSGQYKYNSTWNIHIQYIW